MYDPVENKTTVLPDDPRLCEELLIDLCSRVNTATGDTEHGAAVSLWGNNSQLKAVMVIDIRTAKLMIEDLQNLLPHMTWDNPNSGRVEDRYNTPRTMQ